ncbi:MAG: MATE family efflux transporter [Pseudomonadota bacterium]
MQGSALSASATDAAGRRKARRAQAAEAARAGRTRMMLQGPIGPTLARLAAPNVVATFVMSAMSVAEGYFAGRMGVSALAGLALVFPLVMLTQMLSAGAMGGAISSAVARALGAGEAARAGSLALAAWIIAASIAAGTALLMAWLGRPIFGLLGGAGAAGEGGAIEAAAAYASVFFPGCITLWLCHSTLSVIRGTGDMRTPSLLLLAVSLGSIPLSGALGLGWGPFPELGMAGLAAGLVIAYAVGAVAALAVVALGRTGLSLSAGLGPQRRALFWDILRVGLMASISSAMTVLTIVLMVGAVGWHGEAALAGYGLGARLEFLMIPVIFGIGAAMTAMVGANIGAGKRARALRVAWTGAFSAAAIVGVIGAAAALAPDVWLRIFLDASEVGALEAGRGYFRAVGPVYGFFALGLALYFASQGAGRMVWPTVGGVLRMAVAFGGALWLGAASAWGLEGVFAAISVGMVVYGGVIAVSTRATGWR